MLISPWRAASSDFSFNCQCDAVELLQLQGKSYSPAGRHDHAARPSAAGSFVGHWWTRGRKDAHRTFSPPLGHDHKPRSISLSPLFNHSGISDLHGRDPSFSAVWVHHIAEEKAGVAHPKSRDDEVCGFQQMTDTGSTALLEFDGDRFYLRISLQRILAHLPAYTGLLVTPEWSRGVEDIETVNPHRAGADAISDRMGFGAFVPHSQRQYSREPSEAAF
jgi:hypothetical protein